MESGITDQQVEDAAYYAAEAIAICRQLGEEQVDELMRRAFLAGPAESLRSLGCSPGQVRAFVTFRNQVLATGGLGVEEMGKSPVARGQAKARGAPAVGPTPARHAESENRSQT